MKSRHVLYAAVAVAFWLMGAPSVNNSEAINVVLPSQYQVIWDQTPFATAAEPVVDRRPELRLEIQVPSQAAAGFKAGSFARAFSRRSSERG